MDHEINALMKNKSFKVINKPIGRNIVESKWLFRIKTNADSTLGRFRERGVLAGFLKPPASILKIPLPLSFGMNPYDYLLQFAPETGGDHNNLTSNLHSFKENWKKKFRCDHHQGLVTETKYENLTDAFMDLNNLWTNGMLSSQNS